jgi:hypothetical protein
MYILPKNYTYASQYINELAARKQIPSPCVLNELKLLRDLQETDILDSDVKYSIVSNYPEFLLPVLNNFGYSSLVDVFDFTQTLKSKDNEHQTFIFTQQVVIRNYKNEIFNKLIDSRNNVLIYLRQASSLPDGRKKSDGYYINYFDFKRWKETKTSGNHMGLRTVNKTSFSVEYW